MQVRVGRQIKHEQVEFPSGDGYREDSLHLRGGRVIDVTPIEFAFLQGQRPELARHCQVLPKPRLNPRLARRFQKEAERAAAAAKKAAAPKKSRKKPPAKKTKSDAEGSDKG